MRFSVLLPLLATHLLAANPPPGVVIYHSPAESRRYVGSPSICILPNGDYLASCDLFGPATDEHKLGTGLIFRSSDRGLSWTPLGELKGYFWQGLFVHDGAAYAMGTNHHHGELVIRRSTDNGATWTDPTILAAGEWHTAPVPVVESGGRLWRGVEDALGGTKWGERYRAHMLSIPADADLLDAANWTISNPLPRDPAWLEGKFGGWLEGNAVVDPQGNVVDVLRADVPSVPEKAAIVEVSADGRTASFDPARGFVDFPGGAKKFTIRKDPAGPGYWSIASIVGEREAALGTAPDSIRNTLALVHSDDLRHWEIRCVLLHHPDVAKHGFQYVDWQFDGNDLVAACRTSWDEAHNYHDANFLTFHRWGNFRSLSRKDDVAMPAADASTSYRYFQVGEMDGHIVSLTPEPDESPPLWARDVSQKPADWTHGPDSAKPFFQGPVPFVIPPEDLTEPFGKHNHQPSIAWLDNGDLLAIWYTTPFEQSTDLTVVASRLRAGKSGWDPASAFFKAADRNMHGSSIFRDAAGTLHHMNGVGMADTEGWDRLAFVTRTSNDNGVTWTPPRVCGADFQARQQIISGTFVARDGIIVQPCDAVPGPEGGSNLQLSHDGGKSWTDPGASKPAPVFAEGATGEGTIAGIHAGVVELGNGDLLALGRGNTIDRHMPRSISRDFGKTWTYGASAFPPIGGGQRLVLKRLREGPLLLVSFTAADRAQPRANGLPFPDGAGGSFIGFGMFAALSFDDGATWPVRRLLTPGSGNFDGGAWTGPFTATADQAEPAGYLAVTQTPDGVIQLISSRLHYRFNAAWIQQLGPTSP